MSSHFQCHQKWHQSCYLLTPSFSPFLIFHKPHVSLYLHAAAFFEGLLGHTPHSVFAKLGTNPFSHEQFEMEARGLTYIREHTAVKAPHVIDVVHMGEEVLLLLEVIDAIRPETKSDFEILGRGLASLHAVTDKTCGFDFPTYLGIFRQDNTETIPQ